MGMTIEDCIHKLDFFIGAYQKLIDENVANGEVVGTGVRGTWTASTPLNKAYSNMIEALQIAKATCGELKEAIELCTVKDTFSMDEVTTILNDLKQDFIAESWSLKSYTAKTDFYRTDLVVDIKDIDKVVNRKIIELKEQSHD